jgi:P-type E1-E2 ATPase
LAPLLFLFSLPDRALTRRDSEPELLPIAQLAVGDIVIVRPGRSIPLDSIIVEGESAINESSLTGESIPVLKKAQDPAIKRAATNCWFSLIWRTLLAVSHCRFRGRGDSQFEVT